MPLFEYRCARCGALFEKLVRGMNAAQAVECPECGSEETAKQFSTFASVGQRGSASAAACAPSGGG